MNAFGYFCAFISLCVIIFIGAVLSLSLAYALYCIVNVFFN